MKHKLGAMPPRKILMIAGCVLLWAVVLVVLLVVLLVVVEAAIRPIILRALAQAMAVPNQEVAGGSACVMPESE